MKTPKLHISEQLKAILPPLSDQEKRQLEKNIAADGRVTDPILYWRNGNRNVIVDGMHRFEIAARIGVGYQCQPIDVGESMEDAEIWILARAIGRRNLRESDFKLLLGRLYNALARSPSRPPKKAGHRDQLFQTAAAPPKKAGHRDQLFQATPPSPKNVSHSDQFPAREGGTANNLAALSGKSPKTVRRAGAYAAAYEKLSPSVKKGLETKTIKANQQQVVLLGNLPHQKQDKVARAVRTQQMSLPDALMAFGATEKKTKQRTKSKRPPKKFDNEGYYKLYHRSLGPLLRVVETIMKGVGKQHSPEHRQLKWTFEEATKQMALILDVDPRQLGPLA